MQKKLWALAVAVSALAVTAGCSTQTQTAEESEVVADNGPRVSHNRGGSSLQF